MDFAADMICRLDLQAAERKPEDFEDDEDLLCYWGFNPNQCHWLLTDEELELTHVYQPLK